MKEQEKRQTIFFVFLGILGGAAAAYALAVNVYPGSLKTNLDWIATLSLLTLGFGAVFFGLLPRVWDRFRSATSSVKYWVLSLALLAALCFSLSFADYASGAALIFPVFVCAILLSPALNSFNKLLERQPPVRFVAAWLLGGVFAWFGVSFLRNFYLAGWQFVLLAVLLNILGTLACDIMLEQAVSSFQAGWREKVIPLAVLAIGMAFLVLIARLVIGYKRLFLFDFLLLKPNLILVFLGVAILSQGGSALFLDKLEQLEWRTSLLMRWIKSNLPGLLLAAAVIGGTFALAIPYTLPATAMIDNYFDTDSIDWIKRLSADVENIVKVRSVHPFVLLILRPPTWLLSLLLNGDKFHAAILLNSMGGGLCVFLTWLFFKRRTGNTTYALLIAALLGLSNSHLILSTFLETYIFSAAALIAFLLLAQSERTSLKHLVPVGLLTFGITITNFIQTCLVYLMTPSRRRSFFIYVAAVIVIAILLAFVQNILYPSSSPFFIPSNLLGERTYGFNFREADARLMLSRVNLLARHITMFDVVAPRPLVLLDEIGCSFPCLQTFYKYRGVYAISSYVGFGSVLARSWFAALTLAGMFYLWKLIKSAQEVRVQTALLLVILFNFVLHMFYGDDPMLYSPDWTYAVIFFFGISYEIFAGKKIFQVALLVFLTGLLINNLDLFRKVLEAISPFVV